ncbi:MAG: hypothetical protein KDI62_15430 [Anaerolineae bacterium]|nr:hypothetical protein [Anaerolineae bacterium]
MTTRKPKLNIDCLIFASNEVLIDVDHSYRAVVGPAVQTYLEQAVGLPPSSEPLISLAEVILLQKKGPVYRLLGFDHRSGDVFRRDAAAGAGTDLSIKISYSGVNGLSANGRRQFAHQHRQTPRTA